MEENSNMQKLIKLYEQKLQNLEPNSEQYNFYFNELNNLKKE